MTLPLEMMRCAGDFTIRYTRIVTSAVAQKAVSHDGTRFAIIFNDATGSLNIGGPDVDGLGPGAVLSIPSTNFPVILTWSDHGPLVQEEWWVSRISGSSNCVVTEVLYRPPGSLVVASLLGA